MCLQDAVENTKHLWWVVDDVVHSVDEDSASAEGRAEDAAVAKIIRAEYPNPPRIPERTRR